MPIYYNLGLMKLKILFSRDLKEVINIENKFYSSTSTDDDFFETVLTFLQARIDKS